MKRYIRKTENGSGEFDTSASDSGADTFALHEREEQGRLYKIFPDTMNKGKLSTHLKAVGLARGICTPLGYHVGRHSFGTLTLKAGIPMESIAKMMGHVHCQHANLRPNHR
ncbi:MAG: tyrosine-type recombinase/integrase [Bacteroidales bacterium]|nr:tyrosine-type recombinase/integrase [Porphyromonas sp.]MDD7437457.1 tyrosine-type recombinase/integrase [Bacteroidales bacterium]MDY3067488.1 tyrosine-type recombinase/integrase [Porphyromonas sp.]